MADESAVDKGREEEALYHPKRKLNIQSFKFVNMMHLCFISSSISRVASNAVKDNVALDLFVILGLIFKTCTLSA
jgi:hypothetical protein